MTLGLPSACRIFFMFFLFETLKAIGAFVLRVFFACNIFLRWFHLTIVLSYFASKGLAASIKALYILNEINTQTFSLWNLSLRTSHNFCFCWSNLVKDPKQVQMRTKEDNPDCICNPLHNSCIRHESSILYGVLNKRYSTWSMLGRLPAPMHRAYWRNSHRQVLSRNSF